MKFSLRRSYVENADQQAINEGLNEDLNSLAQFEFVGAGSPETVVTAPPGSTYRNRSGGAGTAFYVKESGTGNTGWIGK